MCLINLPERANKTATADAIAANVLHRINIFDSHDLQATAISPIYSISDSRVRSDLRLLRLHISKAQCPDQQTKRSGCMATRAGDSTGLKMAPYRNLLFWRRRRAHAIFWQWSLSGALALISQTHSTCVLPNILLLVWPLSLTTPKSSVIRHASTALCQRTSSLFVYPERYCFMHSIHIMPTTTILPLPSLLPLRSHLFPIPRPRIF